MERKISRDHSVVIETIDLDDVEDGKNSSKSLANTPDSIILDDDPPKTKYPDKNKVISACMKKGMSPVLCKFVQKCLEIEDSDGMVKVLNILIKFYKRIASDMKQRSAKIDKLFNKGIKCLEDEQSQRFTHIKMVYDGLNFYRALNRCEKKNKLNNIKRNKPKTTTFNVDSNVVVDITEIEDNVVNIDTEHDQNTSISRSDDEISVCTIKSRIIFEGTECAIERDNNKKNNNTTNKPQPMLTNHYGGNHDTVRLDSSDEENSVHDKIIFEDTECASDRNVNNELNNSMVNKPQRILLNHNEVDQDSMKLDSSDEEIELVDIIDNTSYKSKIGEADNVKHSKESLLMPVGWSGIQKEMSVDDKIKQIENSIAVYKKKIAFYEIKEICDDTKKSPYLITLKLKAKVVSLYYQLCELLGRDPVKRREVKLKVPDGFPSGPTTRLEKLINSNISSNGNPPFPDFNDVLLCVKNANTCDKLGWNNERISQEAQSLFDQCGRALQQWRQRRDWSDVVSRVNKNELDEDPADRDPELMAKLMQNKKVAISKENDVFERFTKMQTNCTVLTMDMEDTDSDNEDNHILNKEIISDKEVTKNEEFSMNECAEKSLESGSPVKRIKLERVDHAAIFDKSLVIEISDSSDSDDGL